MGNGLGQIRIRNSQRVESGFDSCLLSTGPSIRLADHLPSWTVQLWLFCTFVCGNRKPCNYSQSCKAFFSAPAHNFYEPRKGFSQISNTHKFASKLDSLTQRIRYDLSCKPNLIVCPRRYEIETNNLLLGVLIVSLSGRASVRGQLATDCAIERLSSSYQARRASSLRSAQTKQAS